MSAGSKFILLLIPGFLLSFTLVTIAITWGREATPTTMFEGIWFESDKIIDGGMILSWFKVIPWAIKYFNDYPLHVIVGLVKTWKAIIVFLGGISFAASWSGLSKDKPTSD